MKIQTIGALLVFSFLPLSASSVSPLYERGYVVMPEPQKVMLGSGDFRFGSEWRLEISPGVTESNTAVTALREDLDSRVHLRLSAHGTGGGTLRLKMAANSMAAGPAQDKDKNAIAEQAYKIDLAPNAVTITANAPAG